MGDEQIRAVMLEADPLFGRDVTGNDLRMIRAVIAADRARWVRFVRGLAAEEGACCRDLAEAFARRVEEAGA